VITTQNGRRSRDHNSSDMSAPADLEVHDLAVHDPILNRLRESQYATLIQRGDQSPFVKEVYTSGDNIKCVFVLELFDATTEARSASAEERNAPWSFAVRVNGEIFELFNERRT
jgi:hypothetical protein